jgi:SpoVK/Ycf46/Vps4 family AAA+-type ATPase
MIGLKEQKAMIDKIIAAFAVRKMKAGIGLGTMRMSMHMCFTGNPGSAKTTVARLLADILSKEGILTTGRFIECGRADLVGKFVGWTATQVKEKFNWARGGILFIDEAYSLVDDSRSFGDEAINTIVQEMENHRDDVVVVFAGYPEKMKEFLERNEGLRSRIAFHVDFPDYTTEELTDILSLMAKRQGYTLSSVITNSCREQFAEIRKQKDFGNGRYVRNLLERALTEQAHRLWTARKDHDISPDDLRSLLPVDFDAAIAQSAIKEKSTIGFAV